MSTPPPSSPPRPEPLHFSFAGQVTVWDPIYRQLEIRTRTFRVDPSVSVAGLAAGVEVTVMGYVVRPSDSGARWIVTQLTLD